MIVATNTTIQNCPFCGSEALAKSNADPNGTAPVPGIEYWCKCQNPACAVSPHAVPTLDEALAAWNSRAGQSNK